MALNIGVVGGLEKEHWQICLMEHGRPVELCILRDATAVLTYLAHTCAVYPEPTITLSLDLDAPLLPVRALVEQQWANQTQIANWPYRSHEQRSRVYRELLIAVSKNSFHSYLLPSVRYLPGIPRYRTLQRRNMGTAEQLCAVVALLSRMREREAAWSEMRFLYLEVSETSRNILVIEDGRIVNGMGGISNHTATVDTSVISHSCVEDKSLLQQAFWEGLTQDLAGLMAVHHFDDIVVIGSQQDAAIERLSDTYQLYLFPQGEAGSEGFDTVLGAALLAEGLSYSRRVNEVVERLQLQA